MFARSRIAAAASRIIEQPGAPRLACRFGCCCQVIRCFLQFFAYVIAVSPSAVGGSSRIRQQGRNSHRLRNLHPLNRWTLMTTSVPGAESRLALDQSFNASARRAGKVDVHRCRCISVSWCDAHDRDPRRRRVRSSPQSRPRHRSAARPRPVGHGAAGAATRAAGSRGTQEPGTLHRVRRSPERGPGGIPASRIRKALNDDGVV